MRVIRRTVQCLSPAGLHTLAYKEWGDARQSHALICVHGLARVADDFDVLAQAMGAGYRVICPDVVGRGASSWLTDPRHYTVAQYVADMVTLIARLDVESVDWVGTSMGGLIGMGLAAQKGSPIRRLVLNDVGPNLNPEAIARIGTYIGQANPFASEEEGAAFIRGISRTFGPHSEVEWAKLCRDVLRQNQDGSWRRHYDPQIAAPFFSTTPEMASAAQAMLWAAYDAITCPTLLLRGAQSDLLSMETAQQMTLRGPKAQLVEVPEVGHAPTLVHDDQIQIIRHFLES